MTITIENGVGETTAVSSAEAIATVKATKKTKATTTFTITGVAVGEADITITNNGKSDKATITVEAA